MKYLYVFTLLCLCVFAGSSPALAQADDSTLVQPEERPSGFRDFPPVVELDAFDPEDAPIRRFWLTARGALGQEVPIEGSAGWFCVLTDETNTSLEYHSDTRQWVFHIFFDVAAELVAGGLATCHRLPGEAP